MTGSQMKSSHYMVNKNLNCIDITQLSLFAKIFEISDGVIHVFGVKTGP